MKPPKNLLDFKSLVKLLALSNFRLKLFKTHAAILYMKNLFLILTVFFCAKSFANPNIDWKIIKSNHFDVIFDAKHQELALIYANQMEKIVKNLSTYFSAAPEKTLIVISDHTDLTNGYATAIPRSTIVIFPVLPGPLESIYEHGDWGNELLTHEYTHILSFEPARGVVKVLRYMFGSIITPNLLLPRWWLEGVAVEMETRESGFGRLRSSFQDASFRSMVVSNTLSQIQIAEINEASIYTWPGGARPYLFGSIMWSEMTKKASTQIIDQLHQSYGGRFPFFFNGPAEDFLGTNYTAFFNQTLYDLEVKIQEQISQLKKISPHQAESFPIAGLEAFYPVISPDLMKMVYFTKDETSKRSIKVLTRPQISTRFSESHASGGISQDLSEEGDDLSPLPRRQFRGLHEEGHDGPPAGTINRVFWFADSKKFLYDKVDQVDKYKEASDLWLYDLNTKKNIQLTFGLRAREAALSPDNKRAVYIQLGAATSSVSILDLESKKTETIYSPSILSTVSFPSYLNEHEIIFGERTRNGEEHLKKINLKTKNVEVILKDFINPRVANKTSLGLVFTAQNNGVPNLYLANETLTSAFALTHTLTATSISAYDTYHKEFYFTELSSAGQQIKILPQQEWLRIKGQKLPAIKPLLADRYTPPPPSATNKEDLNKNYEVKDYFPASYLLPTYWFPAYVAGSKGDYYGFATSAADPVGFHTYSISAGYDTYLKESNHLLLYKNNSTNAELTLGSTSVRTALGLSTLQLKNSTQVASARWQFPKLSTDLYGGLGWNWASRDFANVSKYQDGPSAHLQYFNFSQSGAQISPESGWGISLQHNHFLKHKDKQSYDESLFSLVKYHSKFLPSRHSIMAKIQGRWVDQNISVSSYEATLAYPLFSNSILPQYLMRGYTSGTFLAKKLLNYTLEYRFPIYKVYRGSGTNPIFIKQFHGALIGDGIQLEGGRFNKNIPETNSFRYQLVTDNWHIYTNTGVEFKADLTLGYHFPITAYFGYYLPQQKDYGETEQFALGFLL